MTEKQLMDTLHDEVTKQLLMRVQSGEATASELSVAVKFLKDNGASLDVITSPWLHSAATDSRSAAAAA